MRDARRMPGHAEPAQGGQSWGDHRELDRLAEDAIIKAGGRPFKDSTGIPTASAQSNRVVPDL